MENKKKAPGRFRRELPLVLMLLPAVILVAVYSYGSMVGTVIAFQKFNPTKGFFGSPWVGFDNFRNLFTMPTIGQVIYNTVFISLCKMIGGIIVPVIFALLLNEVARISVKRTYQTLVYLPHFLSWVILAGIFKDIFSQTGVINTALSALGMPPFSFLRSSIFLTSPIRLFISITRPIVNASILTALGLLSRITLTAPVAVVVIVSLRWTPYSIG